MWRLWPRWRWWWRWYWRVSPESRHSGTTSRTRAWADHRRGNSPPKHICPIPFSSSSLLAAPPPTPTPRPQPHRHPRCRNAPRPLPANRGRRHCGHLRHLRRRRLFRRSSRAAPPRPVGRVLATLREARGPMPPLGDEQGVIRCSGWLPNPTLLRMDCRAAAGPCVRSEPAARRPHLGHPQNVYEHLAGPL